MPAPAGRAEENPVHAEAHRRCSWNGLADLRPVLLGFLTRVARGDVDVEDVAQETLLRAARYRHRLGDEERLRPWLLRIALNVLRDRVRREARLPRAEIDDEDLDMFEGREAIPGEPEEEDGIELSGVVVERTSAFAHLSAAMDGLRDEERCALSTWYALEPGPGRAARVCEESPPLARVRVFRARRRLTRSLLLRFAQDERLGWPRGARCPETAAGPGARCAAGAAVDATTLDTAPSAPRSER
jgi:RNA polymerase sigma factor (sigma-70 family)